MAAPPRLLLFRWLAVSLPILVLGLAEGILRLFGLGGYPRFVRDVGEWRGSRLMMVEPAATRPYFFAARERPGYADQFVFLMPKPAGTFRIFLVGESAAKGYPQPPNLSMGSFLQAMLQDLHPDKKIELINLGTTGVSTFPLVYMVRELVRYSPDLVIVYAGNNEFYGAYGVASTSRGLGSRAGMKAQRAIRSLAVLQKLDEILHPPPTTETSLMEIMMGDPGLDPADPRREQAARNLAENIREMIQTCRQAGVPVLVCTTAVNEAGLAPIGNPPVLNPAMPGGTAADQAEQILTSQPAAAEKLLREHLAIQPQNARAWFLLGRALAWLKQDGPALEAFQKANRFDRMPWRPSDDLQESIRSAAREEQAPLCDVQAWFRTNSLGGAIGWDLLDDHVHPSLEGQAQAARAMLASLIILEGSWATPQARLSALPSNSDYAKKLGANDWDRYGTWHGLRVIFHVPFLRRSNPDAYQRYDSAARSVENNFSPAMTETIKLWQSFRPHAGGKRPITAMVGRQHLRESNFQEALPLYQIAQNQVPLFTSWHMEYVYFELACREKLNGRLDESDQAKAREELERGRFLLQRGFSESGMAERYMGRIHQMLGENLEAIPYLEAARPRMQTMDLVATDQALVSAYLKTNQPEKARSIIMEGIEKSGEFRPFYQQLQRLLP
jgi:tetratricopeptide (TPR) repeat protein